MIKEIKYKLAQYIFKKFIKKNVILMDRSPDFDFTRYIDIKIFGVLVASIKLTARLNSQGYIYELVEW